VTLPHDEALPAGTPPPATPETGTMPAAGTLPSRHDFYELCVQSPADLVPFLRAIIGNNSGEQASDLVLGEDFAGTAALSFAWVNDRPDARAIAVDIDADTLAYRGTHDRIDRITGDVRTATDPQHHACDAIFVGNFSIGEIHHRPGLVEYFRRSRERLTAREHPGVFVCDTYGGESTYLLGEVHRDHPMPADWSDRFDLPRGCRVRYTWEQREANPLTARVVNVCHFRVELAGTILHEWPDAFVYTWRLWSVPELRDALTEAGFRETHVYAKLADAVDDQGRAYVTPVNDPDDLDDSFIVCVCGVA
jgi:hypothetical protein